MRKYNQIFSIPPTSIIDRKDNNYKYKSKKLTV
jgi:hypothetical protein